MANNNSNSGFFLDVTSNDTLINNTANYNSNYGFKLLYSSYNTLKYNIGKYNGQDDYFASDSSTTILINNEFTNVYTTVNNASSINSSSGNRGGQSGPSSTPSFSYIEIMGALTLLILFKRRK